MMRNSIDLYKAIEFLPNLLDKYPSEFMPLVIRLATYLIDEDGLVRQERRAKLSQAVQNFINEDDNTSQKESVEDSAWPLEDYSSVWYSESKNHDKEQLITLIQQTVTQWVQKREVEKVKLATKMLLPRRLAIFPTVLIHCLRQDVATWQEELLNILSNEVFYRRMSCWYELGEALKVALPHASDEWVDNWIRAVESALLYDEKKIARLTFFACCPEERLPQRIRDELSDARTQNIPLENRPLFRMGKVFSRDAFEMDLETVDDVDLRETLRRLRELDTKSLNDPLNEADAEMANQLVLKILRGDFDILRKCTEATTVNQFVESKIREEIGFIDPYNLAFGLAAHLIRDNQANEEVKQRAEQRAWNTLSQAVPSHYTEEPSPDRFSAIPNDMFGHSVEVLAYLIRYQPTPKHCDKYLELIRHKNGEVRWTALLHLPSPKGKVEWYCNILKERAENEWLANCLDFVCRYLCHLTRFRDTLNFAIETIGILLTRLTSAEQSNIQAPNECLKQLAEFFGSAVSVPDCPRDFYDWALACARGEFGHDALMSSVFGTKEGLIIRNEDIAWNQVRKLYKTALAHIEPQELTHASIWITSPLKDNKHPEMFEELLPILRILASKSTGMMLFSFSRDLETHLQKYPVECLDIFEIVTSQERQKLTEDWDGSSLGIDTTAEILQELDPFVPKEHRERLGECIGRLAKLENPTAQKHLLTFEL